MDNLLSCDAKLLFFASRLPCAENFVMKDAVIRKNADRTLFEEYLKDFESGEFGLDVFKTKILKVQYLSYLSDINLTEM